MHARSQNTAVAVSGYGPSNGRNAFISAVLVLAQFSRNELFKIIRTFLENSRF